MSKYLAKLTPLEPYFFGNEKTFVFSNSDSDRYYIFSERMPMQTTILGMIRRLLIPAKVYDPSFIYSDTQRDIIGKWIGFKSFDIESQDTQDFGHIQSISPVFLKKDEELLIPLPFDHRNERDTVCYTPLKMGNCKMKTSFGEILLPEDFQAKKGIADGFVSVSSNKIYKAEDIFKEVERVGIKKHGRKGKDEKGFFKREYKMLDGDFSFAFYFELKDGTEIKDSIVYLGQKKSPFELSICQTEQSDIRFNAQGGQRVYLLSDSYCKEDVYDCCDFCITGTRDFRNLAVTNDSRQGYYRKLTKAKYKINLLKAGSVFYVKDMGCFKRHMDNENCRKIGFNKYLILGD